VPIHSSRRLALPILVAAPLLLSAAADDQPTVPERVVTLQDAIAWKRVGTPALSPDGAWIAYRYGAEYAPGEVVARSTREEVGAWVARLDRVIQASDEEVAVGRLLVGSFQRR